MRSSSHSSRDVLLMKCQSTIQALQNEIDQLSRKNKELTLLNSELQEKLYKNEENSKREELMSRREDSFKRNEELKDLRSRYTRVLAELEQTTLRMTDIQRKAGEKERDYAKNVI
jgi:hypothetical protein